MTTSTDAERAAYRQHLHTIGNTALMDVFVGATLANGFGQRDQDLADVRAEMLRRMTGGAAR